MKRRILLALLALLLLVGIPTGLLVREYHHEQASQVLIAAIKAALSHRVELVEQLIRMGARLDAKDKYDRTTLSYMDPDGFQNVLFSKEIYELLKAAGAKE